MGKRSDYVKRPRDAYFTPEDAFKPVAKYFHENTIFAEPCAGDGRLAAHVEKWVEGALCSFAMDIEPQAPHIIKGDAKVLNSEAVEYCDYIITNPPYTWSELAPMLDRWIPLLPTALLLPADFMHNKRFAKYLKHCGLIISIGRVKWIEDSKMSGVDNYAWYFFTPEQMGDTIFRGRE
jgi:hypothetical protein